jgi:hypothetical protein
MPLREVAQPEVRFGGVHALRGVNLTVEAGTVTGLIGPDGTGKLPGNAQDFFIGAGTVALAFYPDGVLAPGLRALPPVVGRPLGARHAPAPVGVEDRSGRLVRTRAA